jgi:hypothetical protein
VLVWCETCRWNRAGTAAFLRRANLGEFRRSLLVLPFVVPVALLFHTQDPFLAYGLDLLLVVALFLPALIRSQQNLGLARTLAGEPEAARSEREEWEPEPELVDAWPRAVRLRGTIEPIRPLFRFWRLIAMVAFVTAVFALTPIARDVGPRAQFAALILLGLCLVPLLVVTGLMIGMFWRDRHLVSRGRPCAGRVDQHVTHMRRLAPEGWTLVSQYRYSFTDPHGTARAGIACEEGRALLAGMAVTVLDSPLDPRLHAPYPASLFVTGPSSGETSA